jgi:hypothetical protein
MGTKLAKRATGNHCFVTESSVNVAHTERRHSKIVVPGHTGSEQQVGDVVDMALAVPPEQIAFPTGLAFAVVSLHFVMGSDILVAGRVWHTVEEPGHMREKLEEKAFGSNHRFVTQSKVGIDEPKGRRCRTRRCLPGGPDTESMGPT